MELSDLQAPMCAETRQVMVAVRELPLARTKRARYEKLWGLCHEATNRRTACHGGKPALAADGVGARFTWEW